MNTKHTPGPWVAFEGNDGGFAVSPGNDPHVVLCSRAPWPQRTKESAANARLIAAAPELLEACKAVAATSHGAGAEHWTACEKARAAIANATGGE